MLTVLRYSSLLLLPFSALCTSAEQDCASPAACNQAGTAAYKAGHYAEAIEAFERQLRRAEAEETTQATQAQELALNNLMLANLTAGQTGMARAWLELALQASMDGAATRHNLAEVGSALAPQTLAASPEGHYLRYAGQAAWSSLDIRRTATGLKASFSPIRVGANIEEYGPAAIGELAGSLVGQAGYFQLEQAGLASGCAVQLLWTGADLRVQEVYGGECQDYGGANISVGGHYYKVAVTPLP